MSLRNHLKLAWELLGPRTISQARRWCLYGLAIFWLVVIWLTIGEGR